MIENQPTYLSNQRLRFSFNLKCFQAFLAQRKFIFKNNLTSYEFEFTERRLLLLVLNLNSKCITLQNRNT